MLTNRRLFLLSLPLSVVLLVVLHAAHADTEFDVPYVPTPALGLLQRDTFTFESSLAYDGGPDGTDVLKRLVTDSPRFLRRGGALLLELGGAQADVLGHDLTELGYVDVTILVDEEDDVRGIEATFGCAESRLQTSIFAPASRNAGGRLRRRNASGDGGRQE